MNKVLVIEGEHEVREEVVSALQQAGFDVLKAEDGAQGLAMLYETQPFLIVMDEQMPYPRVRQVSDAPLIVLGDHREELSFAKALYLGADAYMTKPFSLAELAARARALLRRYKPMYCYPRLIPETRMVELPDSATALSPTEFRLFSCLVFNEGRVMPYPQLMVEVWGGTISMATLHLYVRRIKDKLGIDGVGPYCILGHRGRGYSFVAEEHPIVSDISFYFHNAVKGGD